MTIQAAQLRKLTDYDELMGFLADELDWPMDFYEADVDDYAFEYTPEELGIAPRHTAKIRSVRQLRPLDDSQPWGVFYLEFDAKTLPVVVLRRILRTLVRRKRATANPSERRVWELSDLIFISAVGKSSRGISFAYFHEKEDGIPQLRTFEWDEGETQFANFIPKLEALRWPDHPDNVDKWRDTWANAFPVPHRYSVSTAKELSKAMAELAKRTKEEVLEVYSYESEKTGPLRKLHESFKQALIQDLDKEGFADMLAQTLAYGLFSVRASGAPKIDLSSLSELPKTNPFLQELLTELVNLAGLEDGKIDFDELSVSDLITLLNDADMYEILSSFGRTSRGGADDPVIHFYEDFLKEYDAAQKVQRGVFYTPKPVVSFIVRSVHELLQTEFGLADGLADTTTWDEMRAKNPDLELPKDVSLDAPFVQILDPATGTGTFLETVIDVIYEHMVTKWRKQGKREAELKQAWNEYVPEHLLPRLYGFELMMAPYAVAHLKLGLKLRQTGYNFHANKRLRVFLTNSLEAPRTTKEQNALDIPGFLSHEAQAADHVKHHVRVNVLLGNPPYSNFGMANRNPWIAALLEDYKQGLIEKKLNLDDDFIKFFRVCQNYINSSKTGILALITNHVYLEGLGHRQMRKSLMETFDTINILDLHGNVLRKEVTSEGTLDGNVFDIKDAGVAIGFFRNRIVGGDQRGQVLHADVWGTQKRKWDFLCDADLSSIAWNQLSNIDLTTCLGSFYFFKPATFSNIDEYCFGWSIKDIFKLSGSGVKTERDSITIHWSRADIEKVVRNFQTRDEANIRKMYHLGTDSRDWKVLYAKNDVIINKGKDEYYKQILYRPFDIRHIWYSGKTRGFVGTPAFAVMSQMFGGTNLGLIAKRQSKQEPFSYVWCSNMMVESCTFESAYANNSLFPLYVTEANLFEDPSATRHSNLNNTFLQALIKNIEIEACPDSYLRNILKPEKVFHYIYAVLHSHTYRRRYAEFLKIDFPRIPLTSSLELFRSLCAKGQALVNLHLMESQVSTFTTYPVSGDNLVEKPPRYQEPKGDQPGRVYINKTQYFEDVPPEVWEFYIGGYQVCYKWLKDRKGRTLSTEDIAHYQKIVATLFETIGLMAEIDEVIEEHGGWPLVGSVSEEAKA